MPGRSDRAPPFGTNSVARHKDRSGFPVGFHRRPGRGIAVVSWSMVISTQSLRKASVLTAKRKDAGSPGPHDPSARRARELRRRDLRQAARDQARVPGLYLG